MQQRTEVVDDASWVMGFLDIIDPAIESLKRLLKLDENLYSTPPSPDSLRRIIGTNDYSIDSESASASSSSFDCNGSDSESGFDVDTFVKQRLSLDTSKLEIQLGNPGNSILKRNISPRRIWRSNNRLPKSNITA